MKDLLVTTEFDGLNKADLEQLEELAKKCPRCGGASANSGNPAGRCRKHLSKLAKDKKTPGHWQRAQTKADDALRRQDGKNGTASKKSSGRGKRSSIVKQTQSAEKKTGQKLSPDRKNNSKGYAAENTRMVPEKLNRGRHKVDGKKLKAWRDRIKKSEIDTELMYTALLSKAARDGNEELLTLLRFITPEEAMEIIDILDKSDFEEEESPLIKALKDEVGNKHTVEVHPDMDHLYRAKV